MSHVKCLGRLFACGRIPAAAAGNRLCVGANEMDWENGRRQTEQYQQDVERCSRQMEDASNAPRQVHDDVPDIGNPIGVMFSVRLINLRSKLALMQVAVFRACLG